MHVRLPNTSKHRPSPQPYRAQPAKAQPKTPCPSSDRIDYAALRKRQAEARAAGVRAWVKRCDAVLRKPKAPGSVEPPLDAYVERSDGGAPYVRATPGFRDWYGRTYVVDVDAIAPKGGGAVLPDQGPGGGDLAF